MNKPKWLEFIYLALFFMPPAICALFLMKFFRIDAGLPGILFAISIVVACAIGWVTIYAMFSSWFQRDDKLDAE